MNSLTSIVFDLDGTLIDSAPDLRAAVNHSLAALSRAPLDLPTIVSFVGNGVETLVERSLVATGGCDSALHKDTLQLFLRAYEADNATLTRIYPGVEARLQSLSAQGFKLGICTNKPERPAREICRDLGIDKYFRAIHGARKGRPRKPDPSPLRECIATLGGVSEQALYVGDSKVDYDTARNAGVRFALFTGGYLNDPLNGPDPSLTFDKWTEDWLARL